MKAVELIQKMFSEKRVLTYPETERMTALGVFFAHLVSVVGIKLPNDALPVPDETGTRAWAYAMLYAGTLIGWGGEVTDEQTKTAHCMMSFPWSRAIVSCALGLSQVTGQGVPVSYKV